MSLFGYVHLPSHFFYPRFWHVVFTKCPGKLLFPVQTAARKREKLISTLQIWQFVLFSDFVGEWILFTITISVCNALLGIICWPCGEQRHHRADYWNISPRLSPTPCSENNISCWGRKIMTNYTALVTLTLHKILVCITSV